MPTSKAGYVPQPMTGSGSPVDGMGRVSKVRFPFVDGVFLPSLPLPQGKRSLVEFWLAFFAEGHHAFDEIAGFAGGGLQLRLELELLVIGIVEALPIGLANERQRARRAFGQLAREP